MQSVEQNFSHELVHAQDERLKTASAFQIAHGATFPADLICSLLPEHGHLIEFGAGNGKKLTPLGDKGLRVSGLEINPGARDLSYEDFHYPVFEGDVRHLTQKRVPFALYQDIETQDGILMQGLFANMLVERDIRHTLRTADTLLKPKGYLFMAEPIHYSEMSLLPFQTFPEYKSGYLQKWQSLWFGRYRVNAEIGLPYGVFAVAKPGDNKLFLDWETSLEKLKQFIASDEFERYAHHTRFLRLRSYLSRYHFTEVLTKPTIMYDRNHNPLIGVISAWQKETARYKYRPFIRGTRVDDEERQTKQLRRLTERMVDPRVFMRHYLDEANQHLPVSTQQIEE